MKHFLLIIALWFGVSAQAAWIKPLPREFTNNEHCQPYQTFETPQAQIRISWCHTDDVPPPGMWMWRLYVWQWCLKTKCTTLPSGFSVMGAFDAIKAAPDQVAAFAAVSQQLRIPVAPGSYEELQLFTVYSRACKTMTAPPYPGAPPQGWTPGWVFPSDYCPEEPVVTVEPTAIYNVTAATAYPLRADGTRSITAWPIKPVIGEACDCTTQVLQFTARYCKVPRLSTAQTTVVAGCTLKP